MIVIETEVRINNDDVSQGFLFFFLYGNTDYKINSSIIVMIKDDLVNF